MHPDLTSADLTSDFRRRDLLAAAERARFADRLPAAPRGQEPRAIELRATAGRALVRAGERLQGLPAPVGVAPVLSGE